MPSDSHPPGISRRALRLGLLALLLAAGAVLAVGFSTRSSDAARLRERAADQSRPTVAVIQPGAAGAPPALELPGRLEANFRAPIYARVSGYLKRWLVDIGTPVKAGQLLAEIEAPDLDQQLVQAEADLATARSNLALAETTSRRWQALVAKDLVSRQEAEDKAGDLVTKRSIAAAAQANLDRFLALKGFTRIVAPFGGVVTARSTDVGALINAGSGIGPELFVVSDIRRLRGYVSVPQNQSRFIRRGLVARISVPDQPGREFPATVETTSQAVNAASGSVLVQLAVENPKGELLPGGFARFSFELPRDGNVLTIPPSALLFGKSGLRVATVGADGRIALKPVTIARDLGAAVEIATGLAPGDRVIESPPDGLAEGDLVRVATPAPATGPK